MMQLEQIKPSRISIVVEFAKRRCTSRLKAIVDARTAYFAPCV
jgi:hypothetical protein